MGLSVWMGNAQAANILLLGDGTSADTQVENSLQTAGHTVTLADYRFWNGATPVLNTTTANIVIALNDNGGVDYTSGGAAAITSFINAGGSFLTTAWTMYDINATKKTFLSSLLPVTDYSGYAYTGDTWTVAQASHPLASGLPASWSSNAGWETITAKTGAQVIISGTGKPLFTCIDNAGGGVVMYLNHDMSYTVGAIEANTLKIMSNAASLAASHGKCTQPSGTPVNAPIDLNMNKPVETFATEIELK